jgi:hypothetical protein
MLRRGARSSARRAVALVEMLRIDAIAVTDIGRATQRD